MPGITRRRRGRGFSYEGPDQKPVSASTRARISTLAIPPAWRSVWICPLATGHLQATGRDAKGRKQYRYHDRWREVRDADKFDQLAEFGRHLDGLRSDLSDALRGTAPTRERVLALVVQLLDETLIRVGNEEYATANESYGLTTLRRNHVALRHGTVALRFLGKSGVEHDVELHDRKLRQLVRRCHELGGQELFSYRDDEGQIRAVTSTDVNGWLHEQVGPDTSAKTFRTWGATSLVVEQLASAEPPHAEHEANDRIVAAIDLAAEHLRNSRAVCRQSYVHPEVLEAYRSGSLSEAWHDSRAGRLLSRPERTLRRVLEGSGGLRRPA
jgi:DNA topoisomerase-1